MTAALDPTSAEAAHVPPEWKVKSDRLVRPTYFPAAMALGVTLFLWGLLTSPIVLGTGFVRMVIALVGWIGEMCHEP